MNTTSRFPGFDYDATDIAKFLSTSEFFTLMLNNGDVVHFTPSDPEEFRRWLLQHHVTDIRGEKGWVICP